MDPLMIGLLFMGGAAAGFINVSAGAGSALTIPLLMLGGLDANVANGTNRLAILAQGLSAITRFHKKEIRPWGYLKTALPPILAGAGVGVWIAVHVPAALMSKLFALIFVILAVLLLVRAEWILPPEDVTPKRPGLSGLLALFSVGVYGGLFQTGVGIPLLLVTSTVFGIPALRANALKLALIAIYSVFVLIVFQGAGQVAWVEGGILALGGVIGSAIGVRVAIDKGRAFIRRLVFIALLAGGAKAFFG
ncbi:sulfite exporter TauE/SafE family protein [Myxococcota bacterium]|nr:sulfite exporter TauE/SafE family protein [Myxococcota bacterium]MBU1431565.1 sulfite exporter TauE/SafE family protein [Myxococcota bacterium]